MMASNYIKQQGTIAVNEKKLNLKLDLLVMYVFLIRHSEKIATNRLYTPGCWRPVGQWLE